MEWKLVKEIQKEQLVSKEKVTQDEIREESRNLIIEGQVQVLALCLNKMRWH